MSQNREKVLRCGKQSRLENHVGISTILQPDPLTELLLKTIAVFEKAYLDQCRERNENYRAKMFGNIVGFEIAAERLEAIFKLSQNRTHADNSRIIESLESSADSAIPGVAKLMKGHGLDL